MTIAKTASQTIKLGENLAKKLTGGEIVCLYGNLGAGKSTFTKGLGRALGVKKEITSPTFALMNIYEAKKTKSVKLKAKKISWLAHIDTYRLNNKQELIDIGGEDYLGAQNTVCVVEWPEKIKSLLKKYKKIAVRFDILPDGGRAIKISS